MQCTCSLLCHLRACRPMVFHAHAHAVDKSWTRHVASRCKEFGLLSKYRSQLAVLRMRGTVPHWGYKYLHIGRLKLVRYYGESNSFFAYRVATRPQRRRFGSKLALDVEFSRSPPVPCRRHDRRVHRRGRERGRRDLRRGLAEARRESWRGFWIPWTD